MNKIQKYRIKAGMSQEDIAALLKIDRSTIAKWETDITLPRADKLPELAKILNCTIDDLFKERSDQT